MYTIPVHNKFAPVYTIPVHNKFAPVYTIPVHNKFAALNDSLQRSVGTSVPIPVHVSDRAGPHQSPGLSVSLAEMAVVGSTDYLIIGDSVLSHMKADKMNTGGYVSPQNNKYNRADSLPSHPVDANPHPQSQSLPPGHSCRGE